MASKHMDVEISMNNNKKNGTLSVDTCIFCNLLIDGESKILNCLHIICKKCVKKRGGISGMECKCSISTEGNLIDYPIISKNHTKTTICNTSTCNKKVTKICIYCKSYYCKPCSKIHSKSHEYRYKFIFTYPMKERNPFQLCLGCNDSRVQVLCTICSVMICFPCHIHGHKYHNYKDITDMEKEIKINISHEKLELEKNLKYLDNCLEETDKQLDDLENKKIIIKEQIEEQIKLIHKAINDRGNQLKNLVDLCISDTVSKIDEKKKSNIRIGDQLNGSKVDTFNIRSVSNVEVDLKFDYAESINSCLSAIKKVGRIVSLPMNSLHEVVDLELENGDGCLASGIHKEREGTRS